MIESGTPFFGKYRGVVVSNVDPMQVGRVQVTVPDVLGDEPAWAMPCAPWAGVEMGMWAVPPVGASVWVEFERGEPDHPIWTGGFWSSAAEIPTVARTAPPGIAHLVLQTTLGTALILSDQPGPAGGIMLRASTGASIVVNDAGIFIQDGKGASIALTGPTVSINDDAMVIT